MNWVYTNSLKAQNRVEPISPVSVLVRIKASDNNDEKKNCVCKVLNAEGGTCAPLHPLRLIFLFSAFWLIFFRACRHFASYSRKIFENLQFAVHIKVFPKNTFWPTTTYSGLCSVDHPCVKILFLVGCFGIGVIWSEILGSVRHL